MLEGCLQVGERELLKEHKVAHQQIYKITNKTGGGEDTVVEGMSKYKG